MNTDKQYHYFYKITNKVNGHFYYGIHSTKDLNDGYMGSGKRLHYAYKKYGIECFEKEILKFFDTRKEASKYEAEVVNETLILDDNCYNICLGGDNTYTIGTVTAKDIYGNIVQIPQKEFDNNPDKYVGVTHGTLSAIDRENGSTIRMTVEDYRNNKHKFKYRNENKICVIDTDNNKYVWINIDDYFTDKNSTKRYKHHVADKVLAKTKTNQYMIVDKDDDRLKTGELTPFWKGRHHKEETKEKQRMTYKLMHHQQGEKNSQYGTCWIMKDDISKKIKKCDLDVYISEGWIKGRKCKRK